MGFKIRQERLRSNLTLSSMNKVQIHETKIKDAKKYFQGAVVYTYHHEDHPLTRPILRN